MTAGQAAAAEAPPFKHEQPRAWQQYFDLSLDFRAQKGQIEAFELAASVSRDENPRWLFEFVTGYGKTLTAFGVFWILKQRGIIDRMLVLVPTDEQRTQFAGDVEDANLLLGVHIKPAWVIQKMGRELRVARAGDCDVFVASYQQLEDGGFFHDLLEYGGRWIVVADECHHLGENGAWAKRHDRLPNVRVRLGLSATPIRSDRAKLLGLPNKPTIQVTYKEAYEEQVVKRVYGNIEHHFLDVDINGQFCRLTTETLKDEGVSDFSRYEAKRQLRYNENYLNQMLIDPLQDLSQREARRPGQNLMIIFAMTCRHAHHVCDQMNTLSAAMGLPYRAEWVGVGEGMDGDTKTPEENRNILSHFKKGAFHILVQVAKAEEGFNAPRASVLVFLHLIGADPKLLQQIGRGLRRNSAIPFEDDTVSIYASADTPLADIVHKMEIDAGEDETIRCFPERPRQRGLWDIPDLILIDSRYDRTDIVSPDGIDILTPAQRAFCTKHNIPISEYVEHFGATPRPPHANGAHAERTPQATLKLIEEQVSRHTSTLTGNILELLKAKGIPFDKKSIGKVKTSINTEWKRRAHIGHGDMLYPEFKRKHDWLQSVNAHLIETREVPSWVEW